MDLVLRCLVLFPLVVILVRIVNRRELSSMEPFDVVLLVVIGDLLQHGRPLEHNLRRQRITVAELQAYARQQGIASLERVAYAVLETNGRISFLTEQ